MHHGSWWRRGYCSMSIRMVLLLFWGHYLLAACPCNSKALNTLISMTFYSDIQHHIRNCFNWFACVILGAHLLCPLGTYTFLSEMESIESRRCNITCPNSLTPNFIEDTLNWLLVYLVKRSAQRFQTQLDAHGGDEFAAKNSSQVVIMI